MDGLARQNGIRVGLLADPPGRRQALLPVLDKLGWQAIELDAWPSVDAVVGITNFLVVSVERIKQATLATVSDAALNLQLRIFVVSDDRSPQTIADVLRCGAHDYLVSPFAPLELEARIVTLATRVWPSPDRRTGSGIHFDVGNRTVSAGQFRVSFSPLEWDVLTVLLEHDGQPISPRRVVDELAHREMQPSSVPAVISRIRHKLDASDFKALAIDTAQRKGYAARYRRSSDRLERGRDEGSADSVALADPREKTIRPS